MIDSILAALATSGPQQGRLAHMVEAQASIPDHMIMLTTEAATRQKARSAGSENILSKLTA